MPALRILIQHFKLSTADLACVLSINNDPMLEIPASYTMDAALGYSTKSWGIQVNVSNITNQVNYSNPWIFNLFEVRPLRRTVITLNYTFDKKDRKN